MNMKTKGVMITASLGLAMLALNGCSDKKLEDKEITVSEFKLLDKKFFNNHGNPKNLVVSADGKHVYLTVNAEKELFHGDADKISEEAGWTNVNLFTGLDGSAGKAKLEKANKVTKISAGQDGALVSVTGPNRAAPADPVNKGVFYVNGAKTYQAAWASSAQDLNASAIAAAGQLAVDGDVTGILVNDKDKDVPYFFGEDSNVAGDYIAMTKGELKPAVANLLFKCNTNFTVIPQLISGGDYLFALTSVGVHTIAKDDIGKTKIMADIAAPAATTDGVIGSDSFKFAEDKVATHANNRVNAVLVSNDKKYLFIALGNLAAAPGNHEGGVAVYEIKPKGTAPEVKRPDIKWNGIAVKSLIKDDKGVVWAVTENNILEAKVDGKKGDSFIDGKEASDKNFENPKDGFKKKSFPTSGIKAAVFVRDKLLIATDEGLMHIVETKKTLVGTKLVKAE